MNNAVPEKPDFSYNTRQTPTSVGVFVCEKDDSSLSEFDNVKANKLWYDKRGGVYIGTDTLTKGENMNSELVKEKLFEQSKVYQALKSGEYSQVQYVEQYDNCLLYTSPSPRD